MTDRERWRAMYLGAFIALGITNERAADDLAEITDSDETAVEAIKMLAQAKKGDRVYPTLQWLRRGGR